MEFIRKNVQKSQSSNLLYNRTKKLIEKYNKNVEVILDLKDETVNLALKNYNKSNDSFQIVWEGLQKHVTKIVSPVLRKLSEKYKIKINIITDLKYKGYLNKLYNIETYKQINKIFKNKKF